MIRSTVGYDRKEIAISSRTHGKRWGGALSFQKVSGSIALRHKEQKLPLVLSGDGGKVESSSAIDACEAHIAFRRTYSGRRYRHRLCRAVKIKVPDIALFLDRRDGDRGRPCWD